jgi:uncharacterized membrane protein
MSPRRRTAAMVTVTVAGLAIATYLTIVHYTGGEAICQLSGGCEKVQTSSYADLAGVPVALLGLIGYAAILATFALPSGDRVRLLRVLLTGGGFAFSAYLTYAEVFVIEAICQWCVASAVVMTILLVLTAIDFVQPPDDRDDRYSSLADTPVS